MSDLQIVSLGAAESRDGVIVAQAQDTVDAEDIENGEELDIDPFGEIDMFSALGHYAVPYPANEDGRAEGLVERGCGGLNAVCTAARDTRAGRITGSMQPGDTGIATTHPKSKAQAMAKGEKNQAYLLVEDSDGETMIVQVDGKNNQIMLTVGGMTFTMKKGGGIDIDAGDEPIYMSGSTISLLGTVVLGGAAASVPVAMQAVGAAGPASLPSAGVWIGV